MAKLTIKNILSGYRAVVALNANFENIAATMERVLFRDGTSPNAMTALLDMGNKRIINLGLQVADTDAMQYGTFRLYKIATDARLLLLEKAVALLGVLIPGAGGQPGSGIDTSILDDLIADVSQLGSDLQTTVNDLAAEIIARGDADLTFTSKFTLLGQTSVDGLAWILDGNKVKLSETESLATRLANLRADLDGATASVATETTARISGDSAITTQLNSAVSRLDTAEANVDSLTTTVTNNQTTLAGQISTINTTVGSHSTSITNFSTSIDGLRARWGVRVDSNGRISGIVLNSDATSTDFVILADKFILADPSSPNVSPFQVVGGVTYIKNAVIQNLSLGADKIAANSVSRTEGSNFSNSGDVSISVGNFSFGTFVPDSFTTGFLRANISMSHGVQTATTGFRAWARFDMSADGTNWTPLTESLIYSSVGQDGTERLFVPFENWIFPGYGITSGSPAYFRLTIRGEASSDTGSTWTAATLPSISGSVIATLTKR